MIKHLRKDLRKDSNPSRQLMLKVNNRNTRTSVKYVQS